MSHAIAGAKIRIEDHEAVLAKASSWARDHGVDLFLAEARAVHGRDHLESAARHAERAKANGTMTTKSLAMETLVYLTGQRQVADAIRAAGLRKGTTGVAIVVFGFESPENFIREHGWTRADDILSAEGKPLPEIGVTAAEEKTVPNERRHDLALEKTALVDVMK